MKAIFFIMAFVAFNASAEVALQDCLDDSAFVGHSKTPLQPLPECAGIVKAEPSAVSVTSTDNKWKAFGIGRLVYVESYDEDSNLLGREVLAGEFPELVSVQKMFIDHLTKRLFIVQVKNAKTEVMIHKLDFVGNVSPLKVMRSESFAGLTSIKYSNNDEIEFTTAAGAFIVNADGESRDELSTKKALTITPK